MGRLKQSVSWWCFARDPLTPHELVRAAAEIGYDAIELVGQDHWQLVKDHGLTIASVGGHQSIVSGLNRRDQHNRIEKEILASLALAEQWKIPNLICFSGSREALDDAEGADITAEGLRRVAPAAEAAGVNLIIELLNSKVDHPDYQCDHAAWGVQVCQMVEFAQGQAALRHLPHADHGRRHHPHIRDHHPYFAHYHTAGNPGRNDMDDTQELNYPPIIRAIQETGYEGYVGHEFIPKGDPIAALRAAYELCDI